MHNIALFDRDEGNCQHATASGPTGSHNKGCFTFYDTYSGETTFEHLCVLVVPGPITMVYLHFHDFSDNQIISVKSN